MSWHIPRSLVNELISAQREQLNTGSSCCLWQTGEMKNLQAGGVPVCVRTPCFRGGWNYAYCIYFVYFWFYPPELSCVWLEFLVWLLCLVRECSSLLTWCYRSREEVQLHQLCEGICVEAFCPSKRRKVRPRRMINPRSLISINCISCLVTLWSRGWKWNKGKQYLPVGLQTCFITTGGKVSIKAGKEHALPPPKLSRL